MDSGIFPVSSVAQARNKQVDYFSYKYPSKCTVGDCFKIILVSLGAVAMTTARTEE